VPAFGPVRIGAPTARRRSEDATAIKSCLPSADHSEEVVRTYRLSRGEAIPRTAHAIAWIVGLVCGAIFIFDGTITRIVLVLFASLLFLELFFEVFEATLDDEGVCEFRSLLRRKRIRAHQVRSIAGGPSDDPEDSTNIRIRFDRGRVSLPGEDFLGLVQDLLALNPAVKLDLADGWFRRMVDSSASEDDEPISSDDPIRDLRRSYTKSIKREERIERIGRFVAFLSFWFLISFVSLCLSPLVLEKPIGVRLAAAIGAVAASVLWLLRRSKVFKMLTR
jgi:hypothetical protein